MGWHKIDMVATWGGGSGVAMARW